MKATTSISTQWAIGLVLTLLLIGSAPKAQAVDVDFTTDPGWSVLGNTINGNNYGYSGATNHAGGAVGEAGGTFARNVSESYFADTNLMDLNGEDPRDLHLGNSFSASGKFTIFGQNNTDQGWGIGHLSEGAADGSFLGIAFLENGDTSVRARAQLLGGSTSDGNNLTVFNGVYNFEYTYDPNIGNGRITARIFNDLGFDQTSTANLSVGDRNGGQSFDGFGITIAINLSQTDDPTRTVEMFVDDLTYTGFAGAPPAHPGDFDGDGDVDGADFVAWQTNFPKSSGATLDEGDADGDGDVDGADFVVWQTNFPFTPGAGASPVPEPSGLAIMAGMSLLGALLAVRRK